MWQLLTSPFLVTTLLIHSVFQPLLPGVSVTKCKLFLPYCYDLKEILMFSNMLGPGITSARVWVVYYYSIISFLRPWLKAIFGLAQDPNNKNVVNCDDKLRSILLGKPQVELAELPTLIKLHFPKEPKWYDHLNLGAYLLSL